MIETIQEIIYLPSLRCNLNCKHCGENQTVKKEDEIDCLYVLEQIKNSILFAGDTIVISGGEPFLNKSLSAFLVKGIKTTFFRFSITSNGYFTEEIKEMVEQIGQEDRRRLSFQISIDGMEEVHNEIRRNQKSFAKAVSTVKYLADAGVNVSINTVVQAENLNELDKMKEFWKQISEDIKISFIPLSIDIAENKDGVYTDEYQKEIWKFLDNDVDRKRVLSKGKYGVQNCHAGRKNVVIGSDGKIYVCLTGAYYMKKEKAENYCLGDLRKRSLDEILTDTERRNLVYESGIKGCTGCTNPCEVNREVNLWRQGLAIREDEVADYFERFPHRRFGDGYLDLEGWHEIERYDGGELLCWSNQLIAKMYIPLTEGKKQLSISYYKLAQDAGVKIFIDGNEKFYSKQMEENIVLDMSDCEKDYANVTFVIDHVIRPCDISASNDRRHLGIGLQKVFWLIQH